MLFPKAFVTHFFILFLLFYSQIALGGFTCDSLEISGLPSGPVAVSAGSPVTYDLTITGGPGYNASKYEVEWLDGAEEGTITQEWISQTGHVGVLSLTYAPGEGFSAGDNDRVEFRIQHNYDPECESEAKQIEFYEASCNGLFEVLSYSWNAPVLLDWGEDKAFSLSFHTWGAEETPEYHVERLGGPPTLGVLEDGEISSIPGRVGKRIAFEYAHSEESSGDDVISFRVIDHAIDNETMRNQCGVEIEIPIVVDTQPDNYYCGGLGASISATLNEIDAGGSSMITVTGIKGDRSSGQFIYKVSNEPENGSLSPDESQSIATSGAYSYTYFHDEESSDGDTISVTVTDALYSECSVTKNVTIDLIDYCELLTVTVDELDAIEVGALTNFTVNVSGGSGRYKYRVVSGANNGHIVGSDTTGWRNSNHHTFEYQHDEESSAGDILTVEVEDKDTECVRAELVTIELIDYCEGFGFQDSSTSVLTLDPGDSGEIIVYANQGNGSGEYVYSVISGPSHGEVEPMTSGITTDESFIFTYTHDESENTDTLVIQVQDAVYEACVDETTTGVGFIDYCEAFDASLSPSHQTISLGGIYSFSASASDGSGSYKYTITSSPSNGEITSVTESDITSGPFEFTYHHNPAKIKGDTVSVLIEDTEYECEVTQDVTFSMENLCSDFSYGISNPWLHEFNKAGIGEEVALYAWADGGSGDYSFVVNMDPTMLPGTLTTTDPSVDDTKVTQHYSYVQDTEGDAYFHINISDDVYECGADVWVYSFYTFMGSPGNSACHDLDLNLSDLSLTSNDTQVGEVHSFTATLTGGDPERDYEFVITEYPTLGGGLISIDEGNLHELRYKYTAPANMVGTEYFTIQVEDANDPLCPVHSRQIKFVVEDDTITCQGNENSQEGFVILDNTANTGQEAISTNLNFLDGCNKNETTIGYKFGESPDRDGHGANVINVNDFQIVNREIEEDQLSIHVGPNHDVVESLVFDSAVSKNNYFTDGQHLFDLNVFRTAANWLSGTDATGADNIPPRSTETGELEILHAGTYGTITMRQFLENIRDGRTMHGIVRVLIGLEKGTCEPDCNPEAINSLGSPVNEAELYGFCGETTVSGLCACAPSSRLGMSPGHHFEAIRPGSELCNDAEGHPIVLPEEAKIMVKGALLWDFVDYSEVDADGNPVAIPLENLSFFPRELYFMVDIPIVINSAYEDDYCGGPDGYSSCDGKPMSDDFFEQLQYIAGVTDGVHSTQKISLSDLDYSMVPQTSKDFYSYLMEGTELTETLYHDLNIADQYHLLMPSGYTKQWAAAFDHLQISASMWESLGFEVPADALEGSPLSETLIRGDDFQDIPVYLYSGGLVDMHSHTNISGLIYVPQALELEAETGTSQNATVHQLVNGAIIVRDGFYIKAKDHSITVLSADPSSYTSIVTANPLPDKITLAVGVGSGLIDPEAEEEAYGEEEGAEEGESVSTDGCLFCSGGTGRGGGSEASSSDAGASQWQQVLPN